MSGPASDPRGRRTDPNHTSKKNIKKLYFFIYLLFVGASWYQLDKKEKETMDLKDYEPFGTDWEKSMMTCKKRELIQMIKRLAIQCADAKSETAKIKRGMI